jgi:rhodanese-related sulfurtransferase
MTAPTPTPATGYHGDFTAADAYAFLTAHESALLVDVRTEGEWQTIGIADLAPLGRTTTLIEWANEAGTPNPTFLDQLRDAAGTEPDGEESRPLVFICRAGIKSAAAARAATEAGFSPVYNVLHGFEGDADADGRRDINGWRIEGLPSTDRAAE